MSKTDTTLTASAEETLDDVLALLHLPENSFRVPELNNFSFTIRGITKREADKIRSQCVTNNKFDRDRYERLLFCASVKEPPVSMAQAEALWDRAPAAAVIQIINKINEINGDGNEALTNAVRLIEGAITQLQAPDSIEIDPAKLVAQLQDAIDDLKGEGPTSKGQRENSFRN